MDIDDEIDKYLKKLYESQDYTLFASDLYEGFFMYNVPHIVDETMIDKSLIKVNREVRMLTAFGIDISKQGGWKKYLRQQQEVVRSEGELQKEIQELTKKQLELSIREMQVNFTQIKHWFWIWIITILASAVLGALFQGLF